LLLRSRLSQQNKKKKMKNEKEISNKTKSSSLLCFRPSLQVTHTFQTPPLSAIKAWTMKSHYEQKKPQIRKVKCSLLCTFFYFNSITLFLFVSDLLDHKQQDFDFFQAYLVQQYTFNSPNLSVTKSIWVSFK